LRVASKESAWAHLRIKRAGITMSRSKTAGAVKDYFDGYLWAITGATITFLVVFIFLPLTLRLLFVPMAKPSIGQVLEVGLIILAGTFTFCLFSFVFAFLPFAIFLTVALRLKIRSAIYFCISGAVTGIVLDLIFVVLASSYRWYTGQPTSPSVQFISNLPMTTIPGLAGGILFWRKSIRPEKRIIFTG
jgi:hypothetical protein